MIANNISPTESIEPLLKDFPEEFESSRLVIRAPRLGDGVALNEAVRESYQELKQWMPWAKESPTIEESEKSIREGRIKFLAREDLWLLLFLKENGQLVGCSGLHRIKWDIPSFEIGYWCRTSKTGNGFIREATLAIAHFAFDQFKAKRVEIRADDRNQRSWKIAEGLGFSLDGILRCDSVDHISGEVRNTRVYSVISPEELKD